jgi:hypothetical protein
LSRRLPLMLPICLTNSLRVSSAARSHDMPEASFS